MSRYVIGIYLRFITSSDLVMHPDMHFSRFHHVNLILFQLVKFCPFSSHFCFLSNKNNNNNQSYSKYHSLTRYLRSKTKHTGCSRTSLNKKLIALSFPVASEIGQNRPKSAKNWPKSAILNFTYTVNSTNILDVREWEKLVALSFTVRLTGVLILAKKCIRKVRKKVL